MTAEEKLKEEWHEHPVFNNQPHKAAWCKMWISGDTGDIEPPSDVPLQCAICGIPYNLVVERLIENTDNANI